jgi:monoamine oxidase
VAEVELASLDRRDFLSVVLGSAASLAWFDKPRRQIDGELVGPNVQRAHRLREAFVWPERVTDPRKTKVAIIGGGMSGLAAAWRLAEQRPEVFELDDVPFGTSRAGSNATTQFPWGAHYVNAPTQRQKTMRRLFADAGLIDNGQVAEQHLVHDPEERVYYRGRWYEGRYLRTGATAEDLAQLERFNAEVVRLSRMVDGKGRRAFSLPTAELSDDAEWVALDKLTASEWLKQQRFTSERLLWLVDYACRDDYGARLDQVSAWAAILYFAGRVDEAHEDDSLPLVTWPEGNTFLAKALSKSVGERLNLRCAVRAVRQNNSFVEIALERESAGGVFTTEFWQVEHAILATPHFVTRRLLGAVTADDGFRYAPWFVANLHVSRLPGGRGFPMCWDNVLYDSPALGYVVATHQQTGLQRGSVLTYYHPYCRDEARAALLQADHRALAEVALADLSRAHPELPDLTTRIDVVRWGHAMIRPSPGFFFSSARKNAMRPQGRLHFAHSDLSALALCEEAVDQGVRAAEEVLARLSSLSQVKDTWR